MAIILVVDDEKAVVEMVSCALNRRGHKVETAGDGKEAIEKFDKGCFDVVITDLNMPFVNGHGLLAHIRQSRRGQTPVIAISGTPWMVHEGSPFDAVLPKPLPMGTLFQAVQNFSRSLADQGLAC